MCRSVSLTKLVLVGLCSLELYGNEKWKAQVKRAFEGCVVRDYGSVEFWDWEDFRSLADYHVQQVLQKAGWDD